VVDAVARRVIQAPKFEPRIMRHKFTDHEWDRAAKWNRHDKPAIIHQQCDAAAGGSRRFSASVSF
jgi:hypothetical protein